MSETLKNSLVFAILVLLQAVEMAAAAIGLGRLQTPLILGCAALQALLVSYLLMDLRVSSGVVRLFAYGVLFWLAVMFTLTMADPLTR